MNKTGERVSGGSRPRPSQPGKAGKHGLGLAKVNVAYVAAVTALPAERRPLESISTL